MCELSDNGLVRYRRYFHLVLLLVWLLRYLEFYFIIYMYTGTFVHSHEGARMFAYGWDWDRVGARIKQIVDDVFGGFVVLFVVAWIYRSIGTRVWNPKAVYITLAVELLLETAFLVYYVLYAYLIEEWLSYRQHFWHAVWMLHLLLIGYNPLVGLVPLLFSMSPRQLYAHFTGGRELLLDDSSSAGNVRLVTIGGSAPVAPAPQSARSPIRRTGISFECGLEPKL